MGSTSLHRRTGMSDKEFYVKHVFDEDIELLAWNSTRGFHSEFYAAIRRVGETDVNAVVIKQAWASRSYYNFSYKVMDEIESPYYYGASESVLNALTPTDNPNAFEWRRNVRTILDQISRARSLPVGTVIQFHNAVKFANGVITDIFRVGKGLTLEYRHPVSGRWCQCRMRNWHTRIYSVIELIS